MGANDFIDDSLSSRVADEASISPSAAHIPRYIRSNAAQHGTPNRWVPDQIVMAPAVLDEALCFGPIAVARTHVVNPTIASRFEPSGA